MLGHKATNIPLDTDQGTLVTTDKQAGNVGRT